MDAVLGAEDDVVMKGEMRGGHGRVGSDADASSARSGAPTFLAGFRWFRFAPPPATLHRASGSKTPPLRRPILVISLNDSLSLIFTAFPGYSEAPCP